MSEVEKSERKRRRLGSKEWQAFPRCFITDLPDVVLKECLSFVGTGNCRFVASTCHRFQEQYSFPTATTWKNTVSSVSCAKFCLHDSSPQERGEVMQVLQHAAASLGNIQVIQWALDDHSYILSLEDFAAAGKGGHLTVLEWGDGKGMTWFSPNLIRGAARNGYVHILEWIHQRNRGMQDMLGRFFEHPASDAALGGHITVLEWLKDNDLMPRDSDWFWGLAIIQNQIHVLDWFHDNGFPMYPSIVERAAAFGRIGVLEWAQNHGVLALTTGACYYAASNGNLDALKWLRENGCPWDGRTISYAQNKGHLDIVTWARDNGCPEPTA